MSRLAFAVLSLALFVAPVSAKDGLIVLPTSHGARAAVDRLESLAKARELRIFARIDHAAGARSIGESLRPTELLIFGHPKGGTPLLQCAQTYGIELPMRVLAWEDAEGKTWLGYSDPAGYAIKGGGAQCEAALKRLAATLDTLVREAAGR